GQPRVLFHPERGVRDDRPGLSRDVGAHPGSGLGGQPRVVHAARRRSARRPGRPVIHRGVGGVRTPARRGDRTQAAAGRGRPMTPTPAVVFDEVSRFYGEVLGVNRVTLNIPPGITSLVGPNGSGKTTLMNLMTGLIFPDHGRILVRGISPRDPEAL